LVNGRFPLLIKILDAQETLSLQVHPPASAAARLEGEPKTEMWYLAAAKPGAELYAGLARGVTRSEFERKLRTGAVAECFHRVQVQPGDAMFVPSGRVHGIGAGCVIFEVQQNSDTTYRVFDWNRFGPDGKARELHVPQSLESIDFGDYEPGLIASSYNGPSGAAKRPLVDNEYFRVEARRLEPGSRLELDGLCIIGVLWGTVQIAHQGRLILRSAGQFSLLPASLRQAAVEAAEAAEFLVIWAK
jgi:mannose-6-phosphate isomerase